MASSDSASSESVRRPRVTMTTLSNGFEVSIQDVPRAFKSDLNGVLPGIPITGEGDRPPLLIVPTAQQSLVDLCEWGQAAAIEKDLLLERFTEWADAVIAYLSARGFWSDSVDPCSGLARRTPHSHTPYPEVDAFETLLRWRTSDANGCKLLLHPRWGSSVYPATLFACAPQETLQAALAAAADSVPLKPRNGASTT